MDALPIYKVILEAPKPLSAPYPEKVVTVGDHIRVKRLDLGLQQKEVASLIEVSEATIWNWENGTTPKVKHWPKIIEFLGYDPEYIDEESIQAKLKNYRRKHGLSRRKMADIIGVDESTVYRFEKAEITKRKSVVHQVEKFFELEKKK